MKNEKQKEKEGRKIREENESKKDDSDRMTETL